MRTGQAAEYVDRVEECAECGTRLVDGPADGERRAGTALGVTSRLLVTLGATLAVVAARRWQIDVGDTHLAPFRLGLAPLISAFIAVEIIAIALPRLRPLRHTGRARLHRAAMWLSLPVACALGVVAASPLSEDWLPRGVAITIWVAAVFALAAIADLVTRFGLGNGYAVLLASAVLPALHDFGSAAARVPGGGQGLLAGVVLASVVGATVMVLRAHQRTGPRLPTCGVIPLDAAALLFALPAPLQTLAFTDQSLGLTTSLVVSGVTTGAIALALGLAFTRGSADSDSLALATVRSLLFVAAVFAAGGLLSTIRLPVPAVYTVILATAVVLDLSREWRARCQPGGWVPVATLAGVNEIEPAAQRLTDASIPVVVRGASVRSLLRFFGPFVPLEIRVPARDHQRARDLLA